MKILLDIDDEIYTEICECSYPNDALVGKVIYQVRNNKPLDTLKDEIENRLYKISNGSTYLDIEREFVRDEIFKIIDGYAESEDLND